MLRKRKFLIGGSLLVIAVAVLMFNGLRNSSVYWYTPAELQAQAATLQDKAVRVAGKVDVGSMQQEGNGMVTRFTITYQGATMPIYYKGVLPSGFKEDLDVTIDGKLDSTGVFQGTQILTKCPSKYVPEESTSSSKGT